MVSTCETNKGDCYEGASEQHCSTGTKADCSSPSEKLLCLAEEAKKELLKEKIKEEIEKVFGAKLSALAKAAADAQKHKLTSLIEGKIACKEFEVQVFSILADLAK